jgi:glucose dehydrogenase
MRVMPQSSQASMQLFAAYVEAKQGQSVLDYDDLLLYWAQMMSDPALAEDVGGPCDLTTCRWRYDPKISTNQRPGNRYACRGVTYWIDEQASEDANCRTRIFMGTNDARVIALDAKRGSPCRDFGASGEIKLNPGKLEWPGEFQSRECRTREHPHD